MRDEVAVRDRIFQSVNFERSFVCQARSLVRLLFGGPAAGWFDWQAARLSVHYLLASAFPNINAMKLFEELCIQFPHRFTRKQHKTFARKVSPGARRHARGVVVGSKTYRQFIDNPPGRRPDTFKDHCEIAPERPGHAPPFS